MLMTEVLVTGGTGYIGSHTAVSLMEAGYRPVIVDNLSNSEASVVKCIARITGKQPPFYKLDLRNANALNKVFEKHRIDSVIHFAGLKAVGESVDAPLLYYENNIMGTLSLCRVMAANRVKKIIFSSSASVYGEANIIPVTEDCPPAPTNPYARTKLMIEQILQDSHRADPAWRIILLRYFNPVGAHFSGLIGESPRGIPNNLMPFLSQVAVGRRPHINVFGNDYPTPDGTGVRDYIHIMDLAEGHIAALKKIEKAAAPKGQKPLIVNLGTGKGYSVLEMIRAFEKSSGQKIPYRIARRRPGDVATLYADTQLARKALGWKAKRNLADMCTDAWRWQSSHPEGYAGSSARPVKKNPG